MLDPALKVVLFANGQGTPPSPVQRQRKRWHPGRKSHTGLETSQNQAERDNVTNRESRALTEGRLTDCLLLAKRFKYGKTSSGCFIARLTKTKEDVGYWFRIL